MKMAWERLQHAAARYVQRRWRSILFWRRMRVLVIERRIENERLFILHTDAAIRLQGWWRQIMLVAHGKIMLRRCVRGFGCSFVRSLVRSFGPPSLHASWHSPPFTQSIHPSIQTPTHSPIHPNNHSFTHPPTHPSIHSPTHPSTNLLTISSTLPPSPQKT